MREGQPTDCDEVVDFARTKCADIRDRIDQLQRIESILSELIGECEETDGYDECPIMETLNTGKESNGSTD